MAYLDNTSKFEPLPSGWSELVRVRNWIPILVSGTALIQLLSQVLAVSRKRRLSSDDWTGILSRLDNTLRDALKHAGYAPPAVRLVTFKDVPKPPRRKRKPKALPAE